MVFGKKPKEDASPPTQWKKKYYDSLDDLEYKEEQWHQVEKLLRNAVVRISLAADPAHQHLNKLLNTLRDDIRNGKDSLNLKKQIDKVVSVIRDLDTELETDDNEINHYSAKKLVDECINRVQWTTKAQQFKRGLARQFNAIKDDEVQKFIHSFTKLVNQELLWYEEELKSKDNEPLQPAVSYDNKTESDDKLQSEPSAEYKVEKAAKTEANETPEQTKEPQLEYPVLLLTLLKDIPDTLISEEQVRTLRLKAATSKTRQEAIKCIEQITSSLSAQSKNDLDENEVVNSTFSSEAVNLLIEFLELITLPDELSTQAETIRQTLISEPDKVKLCLNQTVELVMALQCEIKDERKELEGFLAELSTRLQEIDNEIKKISGVGSKRSENLKQAEDSLSEAADNIENLLNKETNIDTLKDSVKSHVIMIRHHMDTFFSEEKKQQSYSDEAVQQLAKELIIVKREAEALREQLEHKRLQATHDTLTRIPNRLAYDEWIEQEHDRFVKYNTPFVLMVWDVDFFKKVNDGFGHQAGDKVLRVIAQMITENIRDADFVARYGGEEFVVVLPGTLQDAAMKVANNIRLAIEACAFHFRDKPVKVTASAGIAEIRENESVQMLFERADKALYKAKESGRNICIAG